MTFSLPTDFPSQREGLILAFFPSHSHSPLLSPNKEIKIQSCRLFVLLDMQGRTVDREIPHRKLQLQFSVNFEEFLFYSHNY